MTGWNELVWLVLNVLIEVFGGEKKLKVFKLGSSDDAELMELNENSCGKWLKIGLALGWGWALALGWAAALGFGCGAALINATWSNNGNITTCNKFHFLKLYFQK